MNLCLPDFLRDQSRYFLLDSSSSGQWGDWRSSLSLARLVGSKRVRLAVAAALALLLVVFFVLPHMFHHLRRNSQRSYPCAVTDWSQFAYSQYVTNEDYLCNSVMAFEALERLGSKAGRVLMYPSEWSVDRDSADRTSQLLLKAKTWYKATLVPVQIRRVDTGDRKSSSEPASIYPDAKTRALTDLRCPSLDVDRKQERGPRVSPSSSPSTRRSTKGC